MCSAHGAQKTDFKTCVATRECERFERGSPKRAQLCVHVDFWLEVAA